MCVCVCIYFCMKCLIQDTKEVCLYKEQFKQPVGPNQPSWGVPHPHFPCSLLSHSLSVHGKVCLTKLPVTHFLSRPYTCTGPWCHGRLSSWTRTARLQPSPSGEWTNVFACTHPSARRHSGLFHRKFWKHIRLIGEDSSRKNINSELLVSTFFPWQKKQKIEKRKENLFSLCLCIQLPLRILLWIYAKLHVMKTWPLWEPSASVFQRAETTSRCPQYL